MAGTYIKRKIRKAKKWIVDRPYYIRRFYNRRRIKSRDFTIISNNCWAGKVYQYLDMPYLTPTVGLYFFSKDYLKFVSNLKYYFSVELEFIAPENSKYYFELINRNQLNVPIGKLDDVEIVFLHYKSESEAKEKWNRRKNRVNFDNIFLKFSNMNLCTEEELRRFDGLPFSNKFMLNHIKKMNYECGVYWSGPSNHNEIINDTTTFPGNLNLIKLLNKNAESYPEFGLL